MSTIKPRKRFIRDYAHAESFRQWHPVDDPPTSDISDLYPVPGQWPTCQDQLVDKRDDEVYVAVMGVTGAGKSSFIQKATGNHDCKIGNTLESETQEVKEYRCHYNGRTYVLIDTPGFDDSYKSNSTIVDSVLSWLESSYRAGTKLNGIIYLHRISDVRMQGSAFDNLRMFRKLCGDDALKSVLLLTTFWDTVSEAEGKQREEELATNEEFWGRMIKKGSTMKRWSRDDDTQAISGVLEPLANGGKCALKAQIQIVDEGKQRNQTDAAQTTAEAIRAETNAQLEREQARMKRFLERQQQEARKQAQLGRERMRKEAEEQRLREQKARLAAEEEEQLTYLFEQAQIQEQMRKEYERKEQERRRIAREIQEEERRKQSLAHYYQSYRCKHLGVPEWRKCDRCGVNLHKKKAYYYHCCHCRADTYNQCDKCGMMCSVVEHPLMTRRETTIDSSCAVM